MTFVNCVASALVFLLATPTLATSFPASYDLRNVSGTSFVTSVKTQKGGTCWTHGTVASMESNLLKTNVWKDAGEKGEPSLAEYHLDWWNGFNKQFNPDLSPVEGGLTIHEGGDYRVAAAYFARGEGAVRKQDGQSYETAPRAASPAYHYYYVRDIDWLTSGTHTQESIKEALMQKGAVGTAITYAKAYYSKTKNSLYQSALHNEEPNHAVTIVGWDDQKRTQAPKPGAWLVKNSWGTKWGDGGYFWVAYADKVAGHHAEMGAVSFNHVEPMRYQQIYFHDTHGWRDTKTEASEAFNAFAAKGNPKGAEFLQAVSFYTAAEQVTYEAKIYTHFDGRELRGDIATVEGTLRYPGHHTVDLPGPLALSPGGKFYVYLKLSAGGHAYDRTSEVPVLLFQRAKVIVKSSAAAGESYYRVGGAWKDLTLENRTANFCMKALSVFE